MMGATTSPSVTRKHAIACTSHPSCRGMTARGAQADVSGRHRPDLQPAGRAHPHGRATRTSVHLIPCRCWKVWTACADGKSTAFYRHQRTAADQFGKTMSVSTISWRYYELISSKSLDEIRRAQEGRRRRPPASQESQGGRKSARYHGEDQARKPARASTQCGRRRLDDAPGRARTREASKPPFSD